MLTKVIPLHFVTLPEPLFQSCTNWFITIIMIKWSNVVSRKRQFLNLQRGRKIPLKDQVDQITPIEYIRNTVRILNIEKKRHSEQVVKLHAATNLPIARSYKLIWFIRNKIRRTCPSAIYPKGSISCRQSCPAVTGLRKWGPNIL